MNANDALRAQFSSGVSSTLEDTDVANKNLLSSIDRKLSSLTNILMTFAWLLGIFRLTKLRSADSLQLDRDACGNLDSMIVPCCGELRELKSGHYHKVVEITDHAGQCLSQEYMVRT